MRYAYLFAGQGIYTANEDATIGLLLIIFFFGFPLLIRWLFNMDDTR